MTADSIAARSRRALDDDSSHIIESAPIDAPARLPYSLGVLLESLLNEGGALVTGERVIAVASWTRRPSTARRHQVTRQAGPAAGDDITTSAVRPPRAPGRAP
ncbi:hypothetical protein AB0C28_24340 [Nonomuraea sp. NPDC048892]|uniref:hypothetical protein n=1 Tax=Nonomuraea sp. NPDC048892 TaxID=3154624 RepID=UPI00340D1C1A